MANQETTSYGQCFEKMSRAGTLKAPPQRQDSSSNEPEFVDDENDDYEILQEAGEDYRPSNDCSPEMYANGIDDASRIARAWFRQKGWAFTGDKSGNLAVAERLRLSVKARQEDTSSTLERMRAK